MSVMKILNDIYSDKLDEIKQLVEPIAERNLKSFLNSSDFKQLKKQHDDIEAEQAKRNDAESKLTEQLRSRAAKHDVGVPSYDAWRLDSRYPSTELLETRARAKLRQEFLAVKIKVATAKTAEQPRLIEEFAKKQFV